MALKRRKCRVITVLSINHCTLSGDYISWPSEVPKNRKCGQEVEYTCHVSCQRQALAVGARPGPIGIVKASIRSVLALAVWSGLSERT